MQGATQNHNKESKTHHDINRLENPEKNKNKKKSLVDQTKMLVSPVKKKKTRKGSGLDEITHGVN